MLKFCLFISFAIQDYFKITPGIHAAISTPGPLALTAAEYSKVRMHPILLTIPLVMDA